MPRERRTRISAHQPSARLSKRQFAVQGSAVEAVEVGAAESAEVSGQDILQSFNVAPSNVSRRERRQLKHEALIDRIASSTAPYSKVQKRRFNRKQREQLGSGLDSIGTVISALEGKEPEVTPAETESNTAGSQPRLRAKARVGLIGEGKGVPLTKAQRKRALEMERLRHPLILANPQYAASPFQVIRTHAQNTLEKHTTLV